MGPLVEEWSRLGNLLYFASVMNRQPGVVGGGQSFVSHAVFRRALPAPVGKALGKNLFLGDFRPLAEGDPAAMTVRHADGVAEPAGRACPSAEEMLGNPAPPVGSGGRAAGRGRAPGGGEVAWTEGDDDLAPIRYPDDDGLDEAELAELAAAAA
jgi:hypothetical protein